MQKSNLESEKPNISLVENAQPENWSDPNYHLTEEDNDLLDFLKSKEIQIISIKDGLRISTGSYIGSAEFSKFRITVNPKFTDLKNIGKLIDYHYNIKDEDIRDFEIKFHEEKNQPMEIIISIFVNQCYKLLDAGLYKSYVNQHDTIPYIRGKLLLQEQIRNESKFNLKFGCEYDEFTADNLDNQILLYCMNKCYHLTENNQRKKLINKFIHSMDGQVRSKQLVCLIFKNYLILD